jgi:hypothetical protein
MSNRFTDLIHRAFFAEDKAALAAIIKDAEKEKKNGDDDDHDEPDGDEGHHIHLHLGDKTKDDQDPDVQSRLKNLEDGFKSIDSKVSRVLDHLAKDGELPEALKKHQFGKKEDDDGDGDGDNGDGDGDEKKDETEDAPAGNEEALTASDPGGVAGAELMEADPALKTGQSMMGDKKMVGRWNTALGNYVRDTAARAEVLSPGIKITKNLDAGGVANLKAIGTGVCDLRRASLGKALTSDQGRQAVGRYITVAGIKKMSCDAVRIAFLQASDAMRQMNNDVGKAAPGSSFTGEDPRAYRDRQTQTLAGINKANREFWAKQTGRPN